MTTILLIAGIIIGVIALFILMKCLCFLGPKNQHLPDCTGKIVIITGSNTGIGFISACEIAKLKPAKLILACRDPTRGQNAVKQVKDFCLKYQKMEPINAPVDDTVEWMPLDLNDLASVKAFADAFNSKYDKLDILMNNAGIMGLPERKETKQGFEQ